MPRHKLPPTPKGFRQPGSGRPKGQPNKVSIEVRQLAAQLVGDPAYQRKLRDDFQRRKVHPTVEMMIWNYHLGKPPQAIEMNAIVDISARIQEERLIFAALDIRDLEQLAVESQDLVNRAVAMATKAGNEASIPRVIESDPSRKST